MKDRFTFYRRVVSLSLGLGEVNDIDRICKERKIKRSTLLREIVEEWLEKHHELRRN